MTVWTLRWREAIWPIQSPSGKAGWRDCSATTTGWQERWWNQPVQRRGTPSTPVPSAWLQRHGTYSPPLAIPPTATQTAQKTHCVHAAALSSFLPGTSGQQTPPRKIRSSTPAHAAARRLCTSFHLRMICRSDFLPRPWLPSQSRLSPPDMRPFSSPPARRTQKT